MTTIAELINNKLNEIKEKGDVLNHTGYYKGSNGREGDIAFDEIDQDNRVHLLFSIIPLIFQTSERKSIGSYGGKHIVEKFLTNGYVSNGEFILVMMCLGYKYKTQKDSPNVQFYGYWVDTVENKLRHKFSV